MLAAALQSSELAIGAAIAAAVCALVLWLTWRALKFVAKVSFFLVLVAAAALCAYILLHRPN